MNRIVMSGMAAAALAGCCVIAANRWERELAADYATPVRPIGVNGQEAWNIAAVQFTYAPTFGFKPIEGAARYLFTAKDETGTPLSFEAECTNAPLSPIWNVLKPGKVALEVVALAKDGRELGRPFTREFVKMPPFEPGMYPAAVCGYQEAAEKIWHYIYRRPYMAYMEEHGEPDMSYPLNSYPSKMLAAQVFAMLREAELEPAHRDRAIKLARLAADRLIARAEPKGTPLEYFTPTYDGRGEAANGFLGDKFKGQHMLHYPAAAGEAFLAMASALKDDKYRAAAIRIADTYVKLQLKNGTWYLKMDGRTGKEVCPNLLVPIRVLTFMEKIAKLTGEKKYADCAEGAFRFLEQGPLTDWYWEGQFEDIHPAGRFENLTKHGACDMAIYLLNRFPGDKRRLAQARELLRWSEDQFVVWRWPDGRDPNVNKTPTALEQYHCYYPIDESAAKLVLTYLALYRAERNPIDLAKAKAIGDAFTRVLTKDGRLRTWWHSFAEDDESADWVNGQVVDALALEDLARECR